MSTPGDITAQPIGVNVAAIEKELAALWRQASQERQVSRACSWNLVVLTPDEDAYRSTKPILDEAVRHVPSRALVLKPRAFSATTSGGEIAAWVSANCQVAPGGGKLLCTEEITVEAHGSEGQAHLPGLIRALNVPDVPTALWWAGAPPTDPSAVRLLSAGVDRLLYDSGAFSVDDAAGDGLKRLMHLSGLLDDVALADLAWLRTGSLRSVFASLFDASSADALSALARVRVRAAARGVAAAKLLIGWLASRLSWSAPVRVAPGALSWSVPVRGGADVRVDIEVSDGSASRDSGVSVLELVTRRRDVYSLTAHDDDRLSVEAPGLPARVIAAHEPEAPKLVVAALGSRGRDRLYPVALHRAVELDAR